VPTGTRSPAQGAVLDAPIKAAAAGMSRLPAAREFCSGSGGFVSGRRRAVA
jgi:hypothetical protein